MAEKFNIELFYSDQKILNATLDQIEKDFDCSGLELKFKRNEQYTFEAVLHELCKLIQELTVNKYESLLHLLYQIDVSEDRIKKELGERPDTQSEEIIAELILKRELQKVVIREFYKNEKK